MKPVYLNKAHRYAGIVLAPFLVLQTVSGLLLDFGLFRRGSGSRLAQSATYMRNRVDALLVKLHFGPGIVSDIYHVLLGLAILWMAVTGWLLFIRIRKGQRRMAKVDASEVKK